MVSLIFVSGLASGIMVPINSHHGEAMKESAPGGSNGEFDDFGFGEGFQRRTDQHFEQLKGPDPYESSDRASSGYGSGADSPNMNEINDENPLVHADVDRSSPTAKELKATAEEATKEQVESYDHLGDRLHLFGPKKDGAKAKQISGVYNAVSGSSFLHWWLDDPDITLGKGPKPWNTSDMQEQDELAEQNMKKFGMHLKANQHVRM